MPGQAEHSITHVIFDMDGLLLDTESRYDIAIASVTKQFGHDYPFELKLKIMGRKFAEGAQIIIDELKLPIDVEKYAELVDAEYRKVFATFVPTMPGAERLVRHLHAKGVPIAVATSSMGFTFKLKTSHHQDLFSLFHHVLIASEDKEISLGKPHPQTFLVAASRFNPPPTNMANVLVFEDSKAGVDAANAAGMISVWVPDPRMPKDLAKPALLLSSLEHFKPEDFGLPPYDSLNVDYNC